MTRIREREERDRHPLESWGLSAASVAEMLSAEPRVFDETELKIDEDWERMLEEDRELDLDGREF